MSKMKICFDCHEHQFNDEGHTKANYETNLPHHDMIKEEMEKDFNDSHLEQYFDGILKDKIASCTVKVTQKPVYNPKTEVWDRDTIATITVEGAPGVRFTEKVRDAISDQIDGQLSDGWGEGFFGYANILTAPDGTEFCVE